MILTTRYINTSTRDSLSPRHSSSTNCLLIPTWYHHDPTMVHFLNCGCPWSPILRLCSFNLFIVGMIFYTRLSTAFELTCLTRNCQIFHSSNTWSIPMLLFGLNGPQRFDLFCCFYPITIFQICRWHSSQIRQVDILSKNHISNTFTTSLNEAEFHYRRRRKLYSLFRLWCVEAPV